MLEIRPDQLLLFVDQMRSAFASRVAKYLQATHPESVAEMDEAALQHFIRQQTRAAEGYGISMEASVVQFIELSLVFGADFHSSGQYPIAEKILAQPNDGLIKMKELSDAAASEFKEGPAV